jgi:predicted GIY-YIG superfamily endonuclease
MTEEELDEIDRNIALSDAEKERRRKRSCVYKFYDKDNNLLYTGLTSKGMTRIPPHSTNEWWEDVSYIKIQHFETRDQGSAAECLSIMLEKPKYNKKYNKQSHDYQDIINRLLDKSSEIVKLLGLSVHDTHAARFRGGTEE